MTIIDINGDEIPGVLQYFRLIQKRMLTQKEMITALVDKTQRYTSGILCEEIVRTTLREVLPNRYTIAQGFVDINGTKSKQCDVLIYDSSMYSPIFTVNDFVILPVGAVFAIIEIKTNLNEKQIEQAIENVTLVSESSLKGGAKRRAGTYIFAFDSPKIKTLSGYKCVVDSLKKQKIEGIYILNKGFLEQGQEPEKFEAYSCEDTLLAFVLTLLNRIYFNTGLSGGLTNPYAAYIKSIPTDKIVS